MFQSQSFYLRDISIYKRLKPKIIIFYIRWHSLKYNDFYFFISFNILLDLEVTLARKGQKTFVEFFMS